MVDSSSDFDLCISLTETETSSADELFSDGLIRPLQLQERFVISKDFSVPMKPQSSLPPLLNSKESLKQENCREITNTEAEVKQPSKSFWRIKHSCSLHCDSTHKKSSFWSLPLLSRSNSTGSIPKALKEGQKQSSNLKQKSLTGSSSSSASANTFYTYPLSQKPPLRKNGYGGSHNSNGVQISPVPFVAGEEARQRIPTV